MEVINIIDMARRFGACSRLRGDESVAELVRLFNTPQGVEFYAKTGYPTLEVMRGFSAEVATLQGVYIDAGEIELHNPERVILAGDTSATVVCDDFADVRHNLIVMHGAKLHLTTRNYAVAFVADLGGEEVTIEQLDNSLVR